MSIHKVMTRDTSDRGTGANPNPRHGWRERLEPGMYRAHVAACPRSQDHKPGGRCVCPLVLVVPGDSPGRTRQVRHSGTVGEARCLSTFSRRIVHGFSESAASFSGWLIHATVGMGGGVGILRTKRSGCSA
jgi:hypothetical protein